MKELPPEAPPKFEVRVVPDLPSLAELAAREFADAAGEAIADRGRYAVALSGGSTPRSLYERLAKRPRREVDWNRVLFFWGDERCVPPTHQRSNYRMAKETLLDPLKIPAENVFRIEGEDPPPRAAAAYEKLLRDRFPGVKRFPRFDFCLMGMGADGHAASLFPGRPALAERRRWAVPTRSPEKDARITLTYPVFNEARRIVFLVAGEEKSGPVATIVKKERGYRLLPASGIRPTSGSLLWLLDQAAASRL